ncbi:MULTISPECIES: hypothetical protein [Cysteiniphilum]|uniref:Uncharacterized protein n=1 Tax=Cysteiniphilum litorale TaxID=2056700 RepID=A0A8J3E7W8_9GAMM|nr:MULTISPECIES: hypothetical protein [Cysteiniphilum]GGF89380.1 hypothetical protein GCM10010995_03360 [Cysteiniphilum litorale]
MLDYSFLIGLGIGSIICFYTIFRLRKQFKIILMQREQRLFALTSVTEKLVASANLQRSGLLNKEIEDSLLEGLNMSAIEKAGITIRGLANRNLSRPESMQFCLDRLQKNIDQLEKDYNDPFRWKKPS